MTSFRQMCYDLFKFEGSAQYLMREKLTQL